MPKPGDEIDREIGAKIAALRADKQITLTALAKDLGITAPQVRKYEDGRSRISASRLLMIAEALGVRPDYFFADLRPRQVRAAPVFDLLPFLNSAEGRQLNAAFNVISRPETRTVMLALIEAIADSDEGYGIAPTLPVFA